MNKNMPKVLAPVGSFEALQAAIQAGADAIYFGVKQLNMRVRSAHNFTLEEMKKVADTCHKNNVECYVTLNTIVYDHDLVLMKKIIDTAKKYKIDAVICQDFAAIEYANKVKVPVHASTQLSISNYESVKFFSKYVNTIVLAREVDLKSIKEICRQIEKDDLKGPLNKPVVIEIFVHGALCIAQSGRCQMSLIQTNTSAQRGACLHECRKAYRILDDETGLELKLDNEFVLSPKDLCTLPFLDKIVETGTKVLKIEGRSKSADYVYAVTKAYKDGLNAISEKKFTKKKIAELMETLKNVYNRGFCEGYYLGKQLPDWSKTDGNQAQEERIFVGEITHFFNKTNIAEIKVQAFELNKGDKYVIIGKSTGVVFGEIDKMMKEDKFVEKSGKPSIVTIKTPVKVRQSDKIYILKKCAK